MIRRARLREHLRANLLDGSEDGTVTMTARNLLTEVVDIIIEAIEYCAEDDHEARCTIAGAAPFDRCPRKAEHLERATLTAFA